MTLEEFDAQWAGDNGATIGNPTPIDDACAPACEPNFHIC